MQVVKFKYYDEFHCIGSECRDSCCKHWRIGLNKREYLDYKKLKCSPKLKEVIDNAFTRIKDPKSDELKAFYAMMKLKEDGDCPFHDTDGLCMLQKELGESVLSLTCTRFPRLQTTVGSDTYIFACNVTCPHVVELLMSHPEGLEIVEEKYDGKDKTLNKGILSATQTPDDWVGFPYYWTLKNAEIDILQNRNFTIQERLLILGFFCKKADEYLENNEGKKTESLYNMMLDNEFCKKVADSLKAPQSDESAAKKSVDAFCRMCDFIKKVDEVPYIKKLFKEASNDLILESISFGNGGGNPAYSATYNKNKYFENVAVFRKIEEERPYILENLLLNQAFITTPKNGIFKNYFALIVFYNTLKISVPAFLKEGWTDSDLAIAITYSAKMILNTHLAEGITINSFKETDSFDLPHAAFLIS